MPRLSDIGLQHLADVDIGVLQFAPRVDGQLRGHGLCRIGQLDSGSVEYRHIPSHLDEKIADQLECVAKHSDGTCTTWRKVWADDRKGPYSFAFSTAPSSFCSVCRSRSLPEMRDRHGLLFNIPLREGYRDVGQLVDALDRSISLPTGFGRKKMLDLARVLERELRHCAEHHVHDVPPSSVDNDEESAATQQDADVANLKTALGGVPIGALGLGTKTSHLIAKGWTTAADLPPEYERIISGLPSVGRRTAERASRAMRSLVASHNNGHISRETFAHLEGIPVIPSHDSDDPTDLHDLFRATLVEASRHDDNPVTEIVVVERICQSGSETATLEEIGSRNDVDITRERVRQIEMGFLRRARTALLDPWDRQLGALFSDRFREPFVALADALEAFDEVGIEELVINIESSWDCSRKEANLMLPMITAIVEGSARTSGELRRLGNLPEPLLRPLRRPARDWPTWNLGAGKAITRRLRECGINTAEELRKAWIEGIDLGDESRALLSGLEYLASLSSGHRPDTRVLADAMGRAVIPAAGDTTDEFMNNIGADLRALIQQGGFFARSEDVFRRRSLVPPEERETTQVLAHEYGISQPSVSRTQTVTLERLHDMLLDKKAGYSGAIFEPRWLAFWHEASITYERFPEDQKTFQRSLATVFDAPETLVGTAVHPVWAILSGRTTKRSYGLIGTDASAPYTSLAPIALKGFRRLH